VEKGCSPGCDQSMQKKKPSLGGGGFRKGVNRDALIYLHVETVGRKGSTSDKGGRTFSKKGMVKDLKV